MGSVQPGCTASPAGRPSALLLAGPLHVGLLGPWAGTGWATCLQAPRPSFQHIRPEGKSHPTISNASLQPRAQWLYCNQVASVHFVTHVCVGFNHLRPRFSALGTCSDIRRLAQQPRRQGLPTVLDNTDSRRNPLLPSQRWSHQQTNKHSLVTKLCSLGDP